MRESGRMEDRRIGLVEGKRRKKRLYILSGSAYRVVLGVAWARSMKRAAFQRQ